MKKKPITIIEITESHIKMVEAPGTARNAQAGSRVKQITDPSDEGVVKVLQSMTTARTKKSSIVLLIPRQQVMVRYFSLPSRDEDEITNMVSLKVAGHVPYPREDIIFDHYILSKDPSGYSKVLTVIMHRDVVNRYFKIFSQCRLVIEKLDISSLAVARWFYGCERIPKTNQETVVLNLDADFSEICFCKQDKLLFSRYIRFGLRDVGADMESGFIRDVMTTFEAYRKENIASDPVKIFVLGPPERLGVFCEKIQKELQVPVESVNPYGLLSKNQNIIQPKIADGDYYAMVGPLGACLPTDKSLAHRELNLLPAEVSHKRKAKEKRSAWVKLLFLVFLNLILVACILFNRVQKQKNQFEILQEKIRVLQPRVETLARKKRHVETIEQSLNLSPLMVDAIYELYRITPSDVSFRLIHINASGDATLQGIAQSLASVNSFQSQLGHSAMFGDVNLQYATQRRVFQGEITDFRITARIIRP